MIYNEICMFCSINSLFFTDRKRLLNWNKYFLWKFYLFFQHYSVMLVVVWFLLEFFCFSICDLMINRAFVNLTDEEANFLFRKRVVILNRFFWWKNLVVENQCIRRHRSIPLLFFLKFPKKVHFASLFCRLFRRKSRQNRRPRKSRQNLNGLHRKLNSLRKSPTFPVPASVKWSESWLRTCIQILERILSCEHVKNNDTSSSFFNFLIKIHARTYLESIIQQ